MRNGWVNESHKLLLSLDGVVSEYFLGLIDDAEDKGWENLIISHWNLLELEFLEVWKEILVRIVQEAEVLGVHDELLGEGENFVLKLSSGHDQDVTKGVWTLDVDVFGLTDLVELENLFVEELGFVYDRFLISSLE